jgi:hypothetical protein
MHFIDRLSGLNRHGRLGEAGIFNRQGGPKSPAHLDSKGNSRNGGVGGYNAITLKAPTSAYITYVLLLYCCRPLLLYVYIPVYSMYILMLALSAVGLFHI